MAEESGSGRYVFLRAAHSYWLTVWPQVRRELRRWSTLAQSIPDATIRGCALQALQQKWGNVEGAAAFATFVHRRHQLTVLRVLVAWQEIYDFADTLSEATAADRGCTYRLHRPLITALEPGNVSAQHRRRRRLDADDGGYIRALFDEARSNFLRLPSHTLIAAAARDGAQRIATYQALYHDRADAHRTLAAWAASQTPPGSCLHWWETAASAASSLLPLALIAAAADPQLQRDQAAAIEATYWPWGGALHTLLDSLVDLQDDHAAGQPSLLDYSTPTHTAARMQTLAQQTQRRIELLPRAEHHRLLIAGMVALYLSAPEAQSETARPTAESVRAAIGPLAIFATAILRLRRAAAKSNSTPHATPTAKTGTRS